MSKLDRRIFLRTSAAGAAGLAVFSGLKASSAQPVINMVAAGNSSAAGNIIVRPLGDTGIKIPVVSMGCGRVDSLSVVKAAMKVGMNHFDTAYVYQGGNSEKMLGEALKDFPRNSYTIATKIKPCQTAEEFLKLFDESLARLQMEYVDILYVHALGSREEVFNKVTLEALQKAIDSGKAKFAGISTHKNEPEVIQAAVDSKFYKVVLSSLNFQQEHKEELKEKIKLASENGIGIIAMKVMAGGFLDKEKTKPVNYKAALRWALQDASVTTAIPSILNLEQLQDNASVLSSIELDEQDLADLQGASAESGMYCNACETCRPQCVKNLPIPELMRAYMYAYGHQHSSKAKELVGSLGLSSNPCKDCSECHVNCVKNFSVREKIADISRISEVPAEFLS